MCGNDRLNVYLSVFTKKGNWSQAAEMFKGHRRPVKSFLWHFRVASSFWLLLFIAGDYGQEEPK